MSKALKLLSTALEHMFQGLEHKFPRREKYFSSGGKQKFVETYGNLRYKKNSP